MTTPRTDATPVWRQDQIVLPVIRDNPIRNGRTGRMPRSQDEFVTMDSTIGTLRPDDQYQPTPLRNARAAHGDP